MYTVSITRLRVRSLLFMPVFMFHAFRTMRQAQAAPGLVDVATRFERGNVVWTKTVWESEQAMKGYRNAGAHQIAMRLLSRLCSEASYARWQQESSTPPTWDEAHRRVLTEGKLSKVHHPSPQHLAGHTAPALKGEA